jgi:hypothetical protein
MSFSYCEKHRTVTAWGCRECLREIIAQTTERNNAELRKKIDAIFQSKSDIARGNGQ